MTWSYGRNRRYESCLLALMLMLPVCVIAQDCDLVGKVLSRETSVGIDKAIIHDINTGKTVETDEDGSFSMVVGKDSVSLIIYRIGFHKQTVTGTCDSMLILLTPSSTFSEVVVSGQRSSYTQDNDLVTSIGQQEIKLFPAIGGEKDVLKTLSILPGIASANEGGADLIVRGGGVDQNLVLFGEAPIYHPSSSYGLMSFVNPFAVRSVNTYKSYIPVQHGGRLSSVIQMNPKPDTTQQWSLEAGIGTLTANLNMEGPIIRDKLYFFASARSAHWSFLENILGINDSYEKYEKGLSGDKGSLHFYDIVSGLRLSVSPSTSLQVSVFTSRESTYGQTSDFDFQLDDRQLFIEQSYWDNLVLQVTMYHRFSPHWKLNANIYNSDYSNKNERINRQVMTSNNEILRELRTNLSSTIGELGFSAGLEGTLVPDKLNTTTGIQLRHRQTNPQFQLYEFEDRRGEILEGLATELSIYNDYQWFISDRFRLSGGLRLPLYLSEGFTEYFIEPRILADFRLTESTKLYSSLTRTSQPMHQVPFLDAFSEVWLVNSSQYTAQSAWQMSLGVDRHINSWDLDLTMEVYAKRLQDLVGMRESITESDLLVDFTEVLQSGGTGNSYGFELALKRNTRSSQAMLSYTYSETDRQFAGINDGKAYPFDFDVRHRLNLLYVHKLSKRWTVSGTWSYHSGRPVTLPIAIAPGYLIYGDLNAGKLPDYHRLDLDITYSTERARRSNSKLSFGVFNAYNRHNPFYINVSTRGTTRVDEEGNFFSDVNLETKSTNFFPIVPYLTYTFQFIP